MLATLRKLLSGGPATGDFASEEDIQACFRLLLGRKPKPEELPGHRQLVGQRLSEVVGHFLSSPEFLQRGLTRAHRETDSVMGDGHTFLVPRGDTSVGSILAKNGTYEPHVSLVLDEALQPGMTFLDIGANIGFFSVLGSVWVGARGRVIAVEPFDSNLAYLFANLQANRCRNVEVLPWALAEAPGCRILDNMGTNGVLSPIPTDATKLVGRRVIGVRSLDDCLPTVTPDAIKIDVEGAEYQVFSGGRELLARGAPVIVSEFAPPSLVEVSRIEPRAYLEQLLQREDYELWVLREDGQRIPCGRDPGKVLEEFTNRGTDHIDIMARPRA